MQFSDSNQALTLHEQLGAALAKLCGESGNELDDQSLRAMIKEIEDSLTAYPDFSQLLDFNCGKGRAAKPAALPEPRELIEAVAEMRLQLIASTLAVQSRAAETELASVVTEPGVVGTIVHSACGVSSALVGDSTMVVLLPNVFAEDYFEDLVAELNSVLERTPTTHEWIVDFSATRGTPRALWGALLMCENRLRFRNKGIRLTFVRPESIPADWLARVTRVFSLISVGGHFFTEHA